MRNRKCGWRIPAVSARFAASATPRTFSSARRRSRCRPARRTPTMSMRVGSCGRRRSFPAPWRFARASQTSGAQTSGVRLWSPCYPRAGCFPMSTWETTTASETTCIWPCLRSPEGSPLSAEQETVTMREGELWVFNNKVKHRADNPAEQPRVHLIFDLLPVAGTTRFHLTARRKRCAQSAELRGPDRLYWSDDGCSRRIPRSA